MTENTRESKIAAKKAAFFKRFLTEEPMNVACIRKLRGTFEKNGRNQDAMDSTLAEFAETFGWIISNGDREELITAIKNEVYN